MAKNSSLEVKRFGKGKERVTVAVLPGHEFEAKHFDPANLELIGALSGRVHRFKSRILPNEHFVRKSLYWTGVGALSAVNEAKVARFANQVAKANGFHDITVEEPLAVHYSSNTSPHVFYRAIPLKIEGHGVNALGEPFTILAMHNSQHLKRVRQFIDKLREVGIIPRDIFKNGHEDDPQFFIGADDRIHIYDVEYWRPSAELKKLLKLRKET